MFCSGLFPDSVIMKSHYVALPTWGTPQGTTPFVHFYCGTKALASVTEAHRMTGNPSPSGVLKPQRDFQDSDLKQDT